MSLQTKQISKSQQLCENTTKLPTRFRIWGVDRANSKEEISKETRLIAGDVGVEKIKAAIQDFHHLRQGHHKVGKEREWFGRRQQIHHNARKPRF